MEMGGGGGRGGLKIYCLRKGLTDDHSQLQTIEDEIITFM